MIVPRQKLFNKVDFDYYDYHKKKGDITPEDEHKFETLKRKYSKDRIWGSSICNRRKVVRSK